MICIALRIGYLVHDVHFCENPHGPESLWIHATSHLQAVTVHCGGPKKTEKVEGERGIKEIQKSEGGKEGKEKSQGEKEDWKTGR